MKDPYQYIYIKNYEVNPNLKDDDEDDYDNIINFTLHK